MSDQRAELFSLTLCDDVRREVNQKFILVGVYTGGPVLLQVPALFNVNIFALIKAHSDVPITIDFEVEAPGTKGKGSAVSNAEGPDILMEIVAPFPMLIEKEGLIKFKWRQEPFGWQEFSWNIQLSSEVQYLPEEVANAIKNSFSRLSPAVLPEAKIT